MQLVRDLMTRSVATLRSSDSVERAEREMRLSNIGHLPIVDRDGILAGVVSLRDLGRAPSPETALRELMVTDVVTVAEDTALTEAAYLILRHRIGSLPVCDAHGVLTGIVTETDFVRLAYTLLGGSDLEDRATEEHESDLL
jgi:CBS domain-containing protein